MRDVETLLEALPYIREFHGQTVVIKYGGAAMTDDALREDFARDVVLLKYVGMNPVIVHGGGPDITPYMERLGLPVEFVGGLRVSDADTVEIAKMVLVGKVNKDIVLRLGRHGQPAVGLSGDDGGLFRVARQTGPAGEDIGYVGRIERVDTGVLLARGRGLHPGRSPRSAPTARAPPTTSTPTRRPAPWPARSAPTRSSSSRTSPAGCADANDPASLVSEAGADTVEEALPTIAGGMRPKLQACVEAIHGGVSSAHIVDGRVPHSLLLELFTEAGQGTKIRPAR